MNRTRPATRARLCRSLRPRRPDTARSCVCRASGRRRRAAARPADGGTRRDRGARPQGGIRPAGRPCAASRGLHRRTLRHRRRGAGVAGGARQAGAALFGKAPVRTAPRRQGAQGLLNVDLAQNKTQQRNLADTITNFQRQLAAQQKELTDEFSKVNASLQAYPLLLQQVTETLASMGMSSSSGSSHPTLTSGL